MKQKEKAHTDRGVRFYYTCVVLVALLLSLYAVSVVNDIYAFVKEDTTATVTVTESMSPVALGRHLDAIGLIKHGPIFALYAKDTTFTPGEYVLSALLDYEDIRDALSQHGT